nr:hypothetical protein CFP56_17071 [Quercus suber]
MDELFSISMHHGGYFTKNPKKYVRGIIDVVDNCDPERWSKVEIEGICRDFRYTSISKLWYKMSGMDQEMINFHLVVDDHDAMYMIELVRGHEKIHVYVKQPVDNPILVDKGEDVGEGVQPLAVEQDLIGYYDNDDSDDSEHDDHDGGEFYNFYDSDDMYANYQTFNNEDEPIEVDDKQVYARRVGERPVIEEVNADIPIEVATSQMGSRRVDKEPIIKHPSEVFHVSDSSDSEGSDGWGSGLEDEVELNHGVRDFVEDNSDSWDGKDADDVVEPGQIGAGVINSDYESEELHNLVESSSDDELWYDSDDNSKDDKSTHVGDGRGQKNEEVRKFPLFKLVAKAEHISFKKDMFFTTPKQFKEAIIEYAYVHSYYHVSTYKACYEPIIAPINGQNIWRLSGVTPVQPPIKRRPPGRPKKKKAMEPNKPTSRRAGISKQCQACGKLGHNRRNCKGEIRGNSSLLGTTNRTSTSNKTSRTRNYFNSSTPSLAKIASATPFAPYQASMHSFSPSAPPQSSMQSPSTPSAPY